MEGLELGTLMLAAALAETLLESPGSAVHRAIADPLVRRALFALMLGAVVAGLIYSPWGRRSGAHFNPAVTLTFLRLGKAARWDAFFYLVFQAAGGLGAVLIAAAVLGAPFRRPPVDYVATVPGGWGDGPALAAELVMSYAIMLAILIGTNVKRLSRWTGLLVGGLIALFVLGEAPVSGMSVNPARTFASALPSGQWTGAWIYYVAPSIGMLLAAESWLRLAGPRVRSGKVFHDEHSRCIFRCDCHG